MNLAVHLSNPVQDSYNKNEDELVFIYGWLFSVAET